MTRFRPVRLSLLGLLILSGVVYGLWRCPARLFAAPARPDAISVSGNIEAQESVLRFTRVQAPVVALPFDEDAAVTREAPLARVDDRLYRRQVDIDRANDDVAAAQITVSESNLAPAPSNVASDQFDLAEKQRDDLRAGTLMRTSAGMVQNRDLAQTVAEHSAETLAHLQSMQQVAAADVGLANANPQAAAAKPAPDEVTFGYAMLRAPLPSGT